MAIQNLPVWLFEPNWSSPVTETLQWLTDIMVSPSGSEQRRAHRLLPRQMFDFTAAAHDDERTLLDNMLISHGARAWYLPLWHDANFLSSYVPPGASFIPCTTAVTSKLRSGAVALLLDESIYDYELVEITNITSAGVSIVGTTARSHSVDTRILPLKVSKLTEQPKPRKLTDRLVTAEIRFQVVEPNALINDVTTGFDENYRGYFILPDAPDERSPLSAGIERVLVEIDNQTSVPFWHDVSNRPFTYEEYSWVLEGRAELAKFESMLRSLRGRAFPVWVPTFMSDFELRANITASSASIQTKRAGFNLNGGARFDREDLMIETVNGRYFRKIIDSATDSQGLETIVLDAPLGVDVSPSEMVRISFMTLMRLNQDSIEIVHETDTDGISTCLATFRSAPDTRVALPAFA